MFLYSGKKWEIEWRWGNLMLGIVIGVNWDIIQLPFISFARRKR